MAKKEVVKTETAKKTPDALVERAAGALVGTDVDGAWGGEEITSQDILIPKILLMQPMSDLVTDGIAKIGEFRDSLNKDRSLGSDKLPVELVVFGTYKNYYELINGEYERTVLGDMGQLPQEETLESGDVLTRTRILNAYCLLTSDIKGGEAFPFVVAFKSTGYKAGKKLMTHIMKLGMFKKPSAAKVFKLSCTKETNDKGTFFVPDINIDRDATPEEMAAAYTWYKQLAKSKVKVDDSDVVKSPSDSHQAEAVQ